MAELATSYAALILADEGIEITADKISTLVSAAKVEVEPIWATLLAKALEGKNVKDLLSNVGAGGGAAAPVAAGGAAPAGGEAAAPAKAEEKKEEPKEESDDDMGFGLFDCKLSSSLVKNKYHADLELSLDFKLVSRNFNISRVYLSQKYHQIVAPIATLLISSDT